MPDKENGLRLRRNPALRVIRLHWAIQVNLVSEKIAKVDHTSEDISGSVCSIDSRAIFCPRLGQELFRNASVASILFPGRKFQ